MWWAAVLFEFFLSRPVDVQRLEQTKHYSKRSPSTSEYEGEHFKG
jgi:hypothetical protein